MCKRYFLTLKKANTDTGYRIYSDDIKHIHKSIKKSTPKLPSYNHNMKPISPSIEAVEINVEMV